MNEVFRRRLIGLAVLLVLAFLLSLLVPGAPPRDALEPSTTVSLSGEILQVTEADAVPPPDDYTSPEPAVAARDGSKPAVAEVAISDLSDTRRVDAPEPAPKPEPAKAAAAKAPVPVVPPTTPGTHLKLAPKVSKPESEAAPDKQSKPVVAPPPPSRPPAQVVVPKPKLAESVARPPADVGDKRAGTRWYVQIGSFSEVGTATTIAGLIRKLGYQGEVSKITGKTGRSLHRVRAGPYASDAAARSAQARIATQGYPQARVMMEPSR